MTDEPNIRFYAGVPLHIENGFPLGSLCMIDRAPRRLTQEQRVRLRLLAKALEALIVAQATLHARVGSLP
ncbi:MAG: hypothetical protein ACYDA5_09670 [Vulcanimicrobiaceae bacterium]